MLMKKYLHILYIFSINIIIIFCIENTYNNLLGLDYTINIINSLSIVEMNLFYGEIWLDYIIYYNCLLGKITVTIFIFYKTTIECYLLYVYIRLHTSTNYFNSNIPPLRLRN